MKYKIGQRCIIQRSKNKDINGFHVIIEGYLKDKYLIIKGRKILDIIKGNPGGHILLEEMMLRPVKVELGSWEAIKEITKGWEPELS